MKVSNVVVYPVVPKAGLVAFTSVIVDGCLRLNGIAIHRRLDGSGYRLTYPTRKTTTQDSYLYHPTTVSLSKEIEQSVFQAVKKHFETKP